MEKVRVFKPEEFLSTCFSARQFGLCLVTDIIEVLKDHPAPTIGTDAYLINKWIQKWFSDFATKGDKNE